MEDNEFEWDDARATNSRAKHGVSFDEARPVFDDPFALVLSDDSAPGQERWRLRPVRGVLRASVGRRPISARLATRQQQDAYFKQAHD